MKSWLKKYRTSIILGVSAGLITRATIGYTGGMAATTGFTPPELGVLTFCLLLGYIVWLCCTKQ